MAIELSDGHRVALNLVYEPFRDGRDWPQQRYVEKALRRDGLSLDSVFEGMPPGLMARREPEEPHKRTVNTKLRPYLVVFVRLCRE
jgi:hypothetical protein